MKIDNIDTLDLVPDFPLFIARDDRERYINYKSTNTKPIDKYECDAMEIISILERLGFSLNEVGTYLYKELIMYIYEEIKNGEEITEEVDEMCNRFIKKLSLNVLEMTIDQYKEVVKESIDCIDGENADIELSTKIFKDSIYDIDANAFEIASYYKETNQKNNKKKKGLFISRVFKNDKLNKPSDDNNVK